MSDPRREIVYQAILHPLLGLSGDGEWAAEAAHQATDAVRAALDATPEGSEPTKDARDVLADRMAKWLGDDAGVYRFADDLWRDLNDAGYDIVPEVVVERLNAANARLSAALDATEPAEWHDEPIGWWDGYSFSVHEREGWERAFVRRPVPSATPAAEPFNPNQSTGWHGGGTADKEHNNE